MVDTREGNKLELLKVHFNNNTSGKWFIDAITGISLNPREGDKSDFFLIRDDLINTQSVAFLGTTGFALGRSIVPVVAHVQGESVLRCLGTGFFISCSGLLVTAAHVITDPIERQYGGVSEHKDLTWYAKNLHLGVLIPRNQLFGAGGYFYRPVEYATFLSEPQDCMLPISGVDLKLKSDIAICKVMAIREEAPYQPLTIVQSGIVGKGMAVGKTATAVGYGGMRDVELIRESAHVFSGEFSLDLYASRGVIEERFPDNFVEPCVPTPGPCFSAAMQLPGGMSGSPIFDEEGIYVHGVVSKGWVDENGPTRFGFGSMLAPSMGLPIRFLGDQSLLDLFEDDEHGFAKLRGPGL